MRRGSSSVLSFPLLFAGLSGLLYLIDGAPSSRKAFGIAYAFGFAFFAFGLSWIGNALLIDAQTFGWLYPVVFLACGFFFGLFIAVPGWLAFRLFHSPASRWLAFSSFWVLFEWIRSFILTGFPWNLLGSVFAFSPEMIQFASQAGTYGLSLICLLSCSAPYFYLRRRTPKIWRLPSVFPLSDWASFTDSATSGCPGTLCRSQLPSSAWFSRRSLRQ